MLSDYVLAGELSKVRGDYTQAFAQYENLLRPFILKKQAAAKAFASSFCFCSQCGRNGSKLQQCSSAPIVTHDRFPDRENANGIEPKLGGNSIRGLAVRKAAQPRALHASDQHLIALPAFRAKPRATSGLGRVSRALS